MVVLIILALLPVAMAVFLMEGGAKFFSGISF